MFVLHSTHRRILCDAYRSLSEGYAFRAYLFVVHRVLTLLKPIPSNHFFFQVFNERIRDTRNRGGPQHGH